MTIQTSLFEPRDATSLDSSAFWIEATLFGPLALTLSASAVAFFGMGMLTGRLSLRQGGGVVLGVFVLLGAPAIAASLMGAISAPEAVVAPREPDTVYPPRGPLERNEDDPYAGASVKPK